jgi:hypothetical protein
MPNKDQRMTDRERAARLTTEITSAIELANAQPMQEHTRAVFIRDVIRRLCHDELRRHRTAINQQRSKK